MSDRDVKPDNSSPNSPPAKPPRTCDDCGDEMAKGDRRYRCTVCNCLVCGWCYGHAHRLAEETRRHQEQCTAKDCQLCTGVTA